MGLRRGIAGRGLIPCRCHLLKQHSDMAVSLFGFVVPNPPRHSSVLIRVQRKMEGWNAGMLENGPRDSPFASDSPYITSAVPQAGREVDVIDEADGIDVPRIPGRGAGLRSALGVRQGNADLRAGASMTSMASVASPAQTGSKYVSGSAGSYHSLIQNCV